MKGDRVLLKKDTDWQQQTPSHKLHLKHSFVLPLFPSSLPPLPHCVWQKKETVIGRSCLKVFPHLKAKFFNDITLKHLLSHTSGIPDVRPRTDSAYVYHSTDVESYSYLDTLSFLNFEPGTSYEYMNPTFQLLYTVIEQASGMPFETYMREVIFDTAGMPETVYFEEGREIPRMAHGYRFNEQTETWDEYDYGETSFFASKADGALYTSVEEFMQWNWP